MTLASPPSTAPLHTHTHTHRETILYHTDRLYCVVLAAMLNMSNVFHWQWQVINVRNTDKKRNVTSHTLLSYFTKTSTSLPHDTTTSWTDTHTQRTGPLTFWQEPLSCHWYPDTRTCQRHCTERCQSSVVDRSSVGDDVPACLHRFFSTSLAVSDCKHSHSTAHKQQMFTNDISFQKYTTIGLKVCYSHKCLISRMCY